MDASKPLHINNWWKVLEKPNTVFLANKLLFVFCFVFAQKEQFRRPKEHSAATGKISDLAKNVNESPFYQHCLQYVFLATFAAKSIQTGSLKLP